MDVKDGLAWSSWYNHYPPLLYVETACMWHKQGEPTMGIVELCRFSMQQLQCKQDWLWGMKWGDIILQYAVVKWQWSERCRKLRNSHKDDEDTRSLHKRIKICDVRKQVWVRIGIRCTAKKSKQIKTLTRKSQSEILNQLWQMNWCWKDCQQEI